MRFDIIEGNLRRVNYIRWPGMAHQPEPIENNLLAFVYDVPFFAPCGVFPPYHLFNQQLLHGGGSGGMSPGATWEPFSLSSAEYRDLADAIRVVPPELLRERARFAHLQFSFDPEFDVEPYPIYPGYKLPRYLSQLPPELVPYVKWASAVCAKHRDRHHAALRQHGFMAD